MKRRAFISLMGGAAAWPLAARAQQQPKTLRVGFVGMQPRDAPHYANFLKRMAELGYQEGRNFTFDYIQTPNVEGYEKNYRELAARKVDVFLAVGNEPALRAALSVADGKPIAFLASMRYFGVASPTSTTIQIGGLAQPEAMVEIEMIAVVE
jgi:putative ABC transport system substrate-binding protein